jgi:predicted DsbA family dithiol-disulfide isomerase
MDIAAMHARMAAMMSAEGLAFAPQSRLYNTRLAQELGAWAEREGHRGMHDALFRAYFVDGVDLGQKDALVAVAAGEGLDPDAARRVLDERTMRDAVDSDWRRARAMGITGVPTFVVGRRGVVGAQPYETLEQLVRSAGAVKRTA